MIPLMSVHGQERGFLDEADLEKMTDKEKEEYFHSLKPKQIRVQAEFIEIPAALLTELRMDKKLALDDNKLRDKLEELLDGKGEEKIKMLESALLITQPGEIARVESIEELIYPTEYEPSEITPPKEGRATKANTKITPPTPCAFETRNVGLTLEVEPKIREDHKSVELKFVPELVYHTGNISYSDWNDKKAGVKNAIAMPKFFTLRANTNLVVADGSYRLATVHSPKDKNGKLDRTRKVLCFVKVDILVVE